MNILLIDQPLWNRGDESAHKGLIRSLVKAVPNVHVKVMEIDAGQAAIDEFDMKLPQVEFVNIHPASKKMFNRIIFHAYEYHLGWLIRLVPTGRKIKRLYKEADMVMVAPGGINLGGFQDGRHLSLLLLAQRMKKPLVYYGRSIGPFHGKTKRQKKFRDLGQKVLKYCSFVCLRDKKSVLEAETLGISCTPTVDSAFLDSTEAGIPGEIRKIIGDGRYLVFVPNELVWHYAFRAKVPAFEINDFYVRLVKIMQGHYPGHKIVMLPQTNNQKRNDYPYFCELHELFPHKEKIMILPDTYSSDVQQAIIKGASLMVGARYHSIVFAINQGIPFISLSYEHKMSGLLEELGETDRMIDITKIFGNESEMEEAIRNFDILATDLRDSGRAKTKAKRIAQECFNKFVESILLPI